MSNLFDFQNINSYKNFSNLPEPPQSEEEIFHSFIDTINNAIGNNAKYDFSNSEDKEKFIDDYLEEFIFCMYNDEEFNIELLEVGTEIVFSKENGSIYYTIKGTPQKVFVSETNKKEATKIYKNPQNGCACFYRFCPASSNQPIYLINFVYVENEDDRKICLYKKVIRDYIELKDIANLLDLRKTIISSFKFYKKHKSGCD